MCNNKVHRYIVVLTIALTLALFSCFNDDFKEIADAENNVNGQIEDNPSPDTTPPLPGNSGIFHTSEVTATSIKINWIKGSDDVTPVALLKYRIFISHHNDIDLYADALANGIDVSYVWIEDIAYYEIAELRTGTYYYINVFVMDEAGNISPYTSLSTITTD